MASFHIRRVGKPLTKCIHGRALASFSEIAEGKERAIERGFLLLLPAAVGPASVVVAADAAHWPLTSEKKEKEKEVLF